MKRMRKAAPIAMIIGLNLADAALDCDSGGLGCQPGVCQNGRGVGNA